MAEDAAIIAVHTALGQEHHLRLEPEQYLPRARQLGVSLAIARPMGSELVVHNRLGNDRVLSAGPNVRGLATLSPWYGRDAIDELKRAQQAGAVGLYLHPSRQGFLPTDPIA